MRVFISSDMEGTAGIVDWSQCRGPGAEYEIGRRLLLAEVNAAIEGAKDGGASFVLVNDAHGAMANLEPDAIRGASYLSGRHKPRYMMQGLDASFDAIFLVSYHGSMGTGGVLSHTYNPRAVYEVRVNGAPVGEAGVNLLAASSFSVPVVLVTGDQVTIEETRRVVPDVVGVVVKEAVTRFAASSLPPDEACRAIREGATAALEGMGTLGPTARAHAAVELEVDWLTSDMAEMATWIGGVDRVDARTVRIGGDEPLALYERFVATIAITRSIVEV
jgi:D-amino peptidase